MKEWLGTILLAGILALDASAADRGPEITNVDQKISISADDITLVRLLRLWDQATAMQSVVPPELANLKVTVHFTGLPVNDAVRKMFDGQPFDYVLAEGRGIVVMDPVQSEPVVPPAAVGNDVEPVIEPAVLQEPQSLIVPPPEPQPPVIIQTPFGSIVSPYGTEQTVVHVQSASAAVSLPPVYGPPVPPFFALTLPPVPPAGAPNGPIQNTLFGPLPVYQDQIIVTTRP
jgi:hypothetical protein